MIIKFNCPCGNTDPKQAQMYHGALGYEAIVCLVCGRVHDQHGIMLPSDDTTEFLVNL